MHALTRAGLVLALALAAAGCEEAKRTNVTGTITRDGKPLAWKGAGGHLVVIFMPEDRTPGRDGILAVTDRDTGTYRIARIPPGAYLVALHQFDEKHTDAFQNKLDPVKTTLRVEVAEDNQVIDIDVPKDLP
jgi:hypothetical protein